MEFLKNKIKCQSRILFKIPQGMVQIKKNVSKLLLRYHEYSLGILFERYCFSNWDAKNRWLKLK